MSSAPYESGAQRQSERARQDTAAFTPAIAEMQTESSSSAWNTEPRILNDPPRNIASAASPASIPSQPEPDVRRCWICQQEETEDVPGSSPWKKICPCSLVAHEDCLYQWIADEEANPRDSTSPHRVVCPQCKSEIRIERPKDLIVDAYDRVQMLAKSCILPFAASGLLGCCYSGLFVYGLNTLNIVFGPEEATRTLNLIRGQQVIDTASQVGLLLRRLTKVAMITDPFFPTMNWKVWVTVPLIGPSLVLLRTNLAGFLPVMFPIILVNPAYRVIIDWPPSPGLVFAVVPYLRLSYNSLYKHTFGNLEKKWELAVQRKPREGETAEEIAQQQRDEEDGAIFEVIVEEEEIPPGPGRRLNNNNNNNGMADGDMVLVGHDGQPEARIHDIDGHEQGEHNHDHEHVRVHDHNHQHPHVHHDEWNFRRDISVTQLASTVTGALFFPYISSMMGDLLYYTLPDKLVGRSIAMKWSGKGLLKEKWGRTVVGGCLFVVLKDVITLYCKWRKAKNAGKKRIMDYVAPK
ncbi:hypothetical protein B0J14DRAFT_582118 [Halenospora varia]|nr:hypothetical protein B0J14DRAFT_582118 [Halenospora varia]